MGNRRYEFILHPVPFFDFLGQVIQSVGQPADLVIIRFLTPGPDISGRHTGSRIRHFLQRVDDGARNQETQNDGNHCHNCPDYHKYPGDGIHILIHAPERAYKTEYSDCLAIRRKRGRHGHHSVAVVRHLACPCPSPCFEGLLHIRHPHIILRHVADGVHEHPAVGVDDLDLRRRLFPESIHIVHYIFGKRSVGKVP